MVIVALVKFLLPALLIGDHPPASAIVGSTAIIIVVLYLAHGVSIRTTSALFGTLAGLLLTADLGTLATNWAHLTGIGTQKDRILLAVAVETIGCWVDGALVGALWHQQHGSYRGDIGSRSVPRRAQTD